MTPYLDDGDVRLYHGDCIEVMAAMEAESVDAVVTDPPYGIGFMGHQWDQPGVEGSKRNGQPGKVGFGHRRNGRGAMDFGRYDLSSTANAAFQGWCRTWAVEALRVLKPGGHLIAFGSPRTSHRLVCGIEDAGFEIRDTLIWLFGSGFPKSRNLAKAIDAKLGVEGETVPVGAPVKRMIPGADQNRTGSWIKDNGREYQPGDYIPATPEAAEWQGWGTMLKPGYEPAVVARKPFPGPVATNVMEHGTGAINVDGGRIPVEDLDYERNHSGGRGHAGTRPEGRSTDIRTGGGSASPIGRWPANVALDEEAAALLDDEVGTLTSGANPTRRGSDKFRATYGAFEGQRECHAARGQDTGGPSRFFYTAKASRAERDGSTHPTVKPLDLMRWVVRLVTPPDGVILDPFAGSGTTLLAARHEGFRAIGIERDGGHLQDAVHRLRQLSLLGGVT